jgi:hypothetical protein
MPPRLGGILTFLQVAKSLEYIPHQEVLSFQVGKMRALLVIREVSAYSLRHRQDEAAIVHVQPVAATHQLVIGVARKGYRVRCQGQVDRSGSCITFTGTVFSFDLTPL